MTSLQCIQFSTKVVPNDKRLSLSERNQCEYPATQKDEAHVNQTVYI